MSTVSAPPGPRMPLLGALVGPGRDPLEMFARLARDYGDVASFRLGTERCYFLSNPQDVRDVLVTHQKNFTKSRGLERAKKLLGEGLLTSEDPLHLRQRRLLQPAFHRDRIAGYAQVMSDNAARMSARWHDGQTVDVAKEMMRVTLAIVGKTLFDTDVESDADEVGVAVTDVLESFWINLLPGADLLEKLPIPKLRRAQAARRRLDNLIFTMIADRRASGRDHGDLLSTLVATKDEDGVGLSDVQVRDEAMTLLLAGHETTANALTWTWYLLSQNPTEETRLHEEVDRVLAGRAATMADVPHLPFVERVVTEAMRLYPPAWIVGRRAIADYTVGGYAVPARSILFMSPFVMHRDARFFPQPERFNPDRWTPEFKTTLPKFAYFPFGGGARQCIGEHFAWMELMIVVASTAARWRLALVPGHPVIPQPLITLRARMGMIMTLSSRVPPR